MIDKNILKSSLTKDEVKIIVDFFHGDGIITNFGLTCLTICHNHPDEAPSRKLYYYENTHLFKCFTECSDTFDIFELIIKCYEIQYDELIELPRAVSIVLSILGKNNNDYYKEDSNNKENDNYLYNLINEDMKDPIDKGNVHVYDTKIIDNLKTFRILDWEKEGINYNTLLKYNIKYYPVTAQIVIPHYNINNEIIGIRGRTVIEEDAERYGKYRPLLASGEMYNHPLGFNLYGINMTKEAIKKSKTAIIFESEKSVLMMDSYFGENNNSVAVCGSTLSEIQIRELQKLEVRDIIIAFDRQYKEYGDEECIKWHDKINKIANKYSLFFNIYIIFDKDHLLGYKDSPIDKGKEVFLKLYERRINFEYN